MNITTSKLIKNKGEVEQESRLIEKSNYILEYFTPYHFIKKNLWLATFQVSYFLFLFLIFKITIRVKI
jgi:hypothetical protein